MQRSDGEKPDSGLAALAGDGGLDALASNHFRTMIDALPAAIYTTDAQGYLTHFNPACVAFAGRTPTLGVDRWCVTSKLFHPDGRPMPHDESPMAITLKTGKAVRGLEVVAERPDGSRLLFVPTPTPLFDKSGKVVGGIDMLVDITERKRANDALQTRERELSDFFETASIGMHWVGPDGVILQANQAELDLLGYVREEYVGHHIAEFHADDPVIQDILARLMRGEALDEYPARLRCKDGSIRDVCINSSVLFVDGIFVHTRCFTRDVTARKQADAALRQSVAFNRSLMDGSPDCVKVLDPDGRLLLMNAPGMCVMEIDDFGPLCGKQWWSLWPDDASGQIRTAVDEARAGKTSSFEAFCPTAKGTPKWWEVNVSPVRDGPTGPVVRLLAVSRDITHRKQAEQALDMAREQAETANVAKDNFIATLSHELRTPLTPVLTVLGRWEREPQFPDALRDDLEMVRRNVDLEARLIDDLLDLTRIARGKLALHLEVLDVRKLLESVINMYRSEISAKRIEFVLKPNGEPRFVRADPGRLQQAFWNLLKNAVKFSAEGGRIEVSTRDDGKDSVQVVVRDEGIGIAPEMLDRLFTPFEQESLMRYGGLGLGLSITRKLLEAQGGSISAKSEGKYRGATFVISLPTVDAPAETVGHAAVNGGNGKEAQLRCFRILIVEDHIDTARVLARLMRGTGHEVTTAHTVADAIKTLQADPFDVLISDVGLPDGSGLDLIRQVRVQHGLDMPAIALTGFGMEEDLARCHEAGFTAHLTKPVNLAKLEETVQRLAAGANGIDCA